MAPELNWFFWLFVSLYLAYLIVEFGLDFLNLRYMKQHGAEVPELFKDYFSQSDYEKSQDYTQAKTHFSWVKRSFDVLVFWALLLSGGFEYLQELLTALPVGPFWQSVAYPFALGAFFYFLGLPFNYYQQFVLEERFGFNRMKIGTFVGDQVKSLALALMIGLPLVALIFKIVLSLGSYWWIVAWAVMMIFQFLTAALFPILLAPLFYKFTPLPDGELKEKIEALAKKLNFKMSGIFSMDGSKRSAHSNAFFAGVGRTRRIVLFDTLIEALTVPEILAVLAHEMGHNVKKHVSKGLVLSSLTTLAGFWLLSLCLNWPDFYQAFGVSTPSLAIGFTLFGFASSVFTFPLTPIFNWKSRLHEYEADAFSLETLGQGQDLAASLLKMTKDNLSQPKPHPWYSFYHYSHPTTAERVQALRV
ncbi:MAG: M48 family metallopeptidase [Deltaproteobacteria bacterium]|nr:M48 family metallopeptidase [Deltaproteobacteria bacterium]